MHNLRKIAVLMGGTSNEREVSLVSGANVLRALDSLGTCEAVPVTLDSDDLSALPAGVDAVFVGPCDLSIDLGIPLQFDSPVLLSAVRRVIGACRAAGRECIVFAGNMRDAKKWLDMGADSVAYSLDAAVLTNAYRQAAEEFRKLI